MNLRKGIMKYGYLFVFIPHGSAEIWGFQYGVTPDLGTLEIMARTGFFGLLFVHSTARLRATSQNQARFWPIERMYEAAVQEKTFRVGNFTERGNEQ